MLTLCFATHSSFSSSSLLTSTIAFHSFKALCTVTRLPLPFLVLAFVLIKSCSSLSYEVQHSTNRRCPRGNCKCTAIRTSQQLRPAQQQLWATTRKTCWSSIWTIWSTSRLLWRSSITKRRSSARFQLPWQPKHTCRPNPNWRCQFLWRLQNDQPNHSNGRSLGCWQLNWWQHNSSIYLSRRQKQPKPAKQRQPSW